MDDDVEYLGTKFAPHTPLDDPCEALTSVAGMSPLYINLEDCSPRPSSGITLHVDKCGERPAHKLTFYRARSSYVNIGRKSGSDDKSMRRENDDHNVVFTCQVVSARHAKLVLSDSGQVYVVDLHSRHGTHLSRRGETTPRMLKAEVETALADGDVLTFGKTVGAGSYLVSPVTVRIELLKGRSSSEIPVSSDRALTPINSLSHVFSRTRKPSSGRYGLFVPLCVESESANSSSSSSSIEASSDSSSSSASEHESDVEDDPSGVPSVVRDGSPGKNAIKIPTFRSFIREMYNNASAHSPPIVIDDADEPIEVAAPGSPADEDASSHPSPVVVVIDLPSKSRSHSPMELSTPSPSPPSEAQQSEPAVVGAWPSSRPESPRHSSLEVEVAHSEKAQDLEAAPAQPSTSRNSQSRISLISENNSIELMNLPPPPPFFPIGGAFSNSIACDFGLPPSIPPSPPSARLLPFHPYRVLAERVSSELEASIKNVENRITNLQGSVEDLTSRQSVTEEDVIDLQSHVDILEPESERLLCRMNGAERNIASLSLLHGLVDSLRSRLDAPEQPKPQGAPLTDVRACAEALNNLVSEMKTLREDVEKRIEEKMEAMKVARTEALDALKGVTMEAESVRDLKRKREEQEENEAEQEQQEDQEQQEEQQEDQEQQEEQQEDQEDQVIAPDVVMDEPIRSPTPIVDDFVAPIHTATSAFVPVPTHSPAPEAAREAESPPPKKRARTAMFTVVHTAAAMAVGAAATWSALAFA